MLFESSRAAFAKHLNFSISHINGIFSGRNGCSPKRAEQINNFISEALSQEVPIHIWKRTDPENIIARNEWFKKWQEEIINNSKLQKKYLASKIVYTKTIVNGVKGTLETIYNFNADIESEIFYDEQNKEHGLARWWASNHGKWYVEVEITYKRGQMHGKKITREDNEEIETYYINNKKVTKEAWLKYKAKNDLKLN